MCHSWWFDVSLIQDTNEIITFNLVKYLYALKGTEHKTLFIEEKWEVILNFFHDSSF